MDEYKKLIEDLILIVKKENASDLHLSEGRYPTIRVEGSLVPIEIGEKLNKEDLKKIIDIFLSIEKRSDFKDNKTIDFSWMNNGERFRGNAFIQQGSASVVLRVINSEVKTLEELGLPSILEVFARKEQGFFLVVGPTGHGKSTTLSSLINLINTNKNSHILTIEDPIEFLYKQKKAIIDQREIGVDVIDFESALSSMFRQDIDTVLIGEMRNKETVEAAVTAAETGHLVFSTLHTNSASQTIDRIIDNFPAGKQKQIRNQLAGSLLGIFSQRLIKSVSGKRIPAFELLINNPAVANLIREGRTAEIDSYIETGAESGMISLNRTIVDLVRKGEITIQDAYSYSNQTKSLERML